MDTRRVFILQGNEVRAHMLTHQPYRNWCRHCVRGKADDIKHMRQFGERMYLVMPIDYTYLMKTDENTNPVLAGYEDKSKRALDLFLSSKGVISVAQRVV